MWINNYDDPEELSFDEALILLEQNGFKNITEEANKQNDLKAAYVFEHPSGIGVYYCGDEDEVIELAINEGLVYQTAKP